jgi:hypothetical protein
MSGLPRIQYRNVLYKFPQFLSSLQVERVSRKTLSYNALLFVITPRIAFLCLQSFFIN